MNAEHIFRRCLHHGPEADRCDRCVDAALEAAAAALAAEEQEHRLTYAALNEIDGKFVALTIAHREALNTACVYAFFVGLYGGAE